MIEVIAVTIIFIVFVVLMVVSIDEAVSKRRAWNLWIAGLIDDDELMRRIGEK